MKIIQALLCFCAASHCALAQSLVTKPLQTSTLNPPAKAAAQTSSFSLYEKPSAAPVEELTNAKGRVVSRSGDTVLIEISHPLTRGQAAALRSKRIEREMLYPDSMSGLGMGHTSAPGFSGNNETICIRNYWKKSVPIFDGEITRDGSIVVSGKTLRAYLWKQ